MCVEHMDVNILNSIEIKNRNCMDYKLFKVKYNKSLNNYMIFNNKVCVAYDMLRKSVHDH